jgi:hypothetical protein
MCYGTYISFRELRILEEVYYKLAVKKLKCPHGMNVLVMTVVVSMMICAAGSHQVPQMTERSSTWSLKNGIFWDVTPCGSCKNQRLGGT